MFTVKGWKVEGNPVPQLLEKKKKKRKNENETDSGENIEKKKKKKEIEKNLNNEKITKDIKNVKDLEKIEKKTKSKSEILDKNKIILNNEETNNKNSNLSTLQKKMAEKLTGSRFRWINEKLYNTTSKEALEIMSNPEMYDEYHKGFRSQVESWPLNPIDACAEIIKKIKSNNKNKSNKNKNYTLKIADMGCGEAKLALKFEKDKNIKFFSFDLHAFNDRITVSDISNVPLQDSSVDIVVFCLALMGTNFLDFIKEGERIIKNGGKMIIAEIRSRFIDGSGENFINCIESLGFKKTLFDDSNTHFLIFEFIKKNSRNSNLSIPSKFEDGLKLLKPCVYKRR